MNRLFDYVKPTCKLCPRNCNIDRDRAIGICRSPNRLQISSWNVHHGEEPPISGTNGSGTIFLAGCNMRCIYCQNYPISQLRSAYRDVTSEELANIMLKLQAKGVHNINFVTPSHFVHLICEAIEKAKEKGLTIPIVFNTSSYDKSEVIELLDEYVDIYLADLKYTDNRLALKLSGVNDYFDIATEALFAMYRTKGALKIRNNIATEGLIVRHLVLPGELENSRKALEWLAEHMQDVPISVMFQYFPAYKALNYPGINRKLRYDEYKSIVELVEKLPLKGYIQHL